MKKRYWYKNRRYKSSNDLPELVAFFLVIFAIWILIFIIDHLEKVLSVGFYGIILFIVYKYFKRRRTRLDSGILNTNHLNFVPNQQESINDTLLRSVNSNPTKTIPFTPISSSIEKPETTPESPIVSLEQKTAVIHYKSGALSDLLRKINDPGITSFKSIKDFNNNFESEKKKILDECVSEVQAEIPILKKELEKIITEKDNLVQVKSAELSNQVEVLEMKLIQQEDNGGFILDIFTKLKHNYWSRRLNRLKLNINSVLDELTFGINKRISEKENRINYTEKNIETIANEKSRYRLERLNRINDSLKQNRYLIYGALGELLVISKLKTLPYGYHVINDYKREFYKPIYNRSKDDRIYSIQIDHIVVGPTGFFIIETKYWSKKSVESTDLFSPVKQIERSAFAMFVVLNDAIKNGELSSLVTHWGNRKISPRQIIASIGPVPHSEFQFVKVLGIEQLVTNITSGKYEYSQRDVEDIVEYLIQTGK